MPPDETEIVRRARAGDRDSFAVLVRRYQAVAVRVAAVVGPQAEAEDAVQEAFVKAHRALGRFDPARPFRPWLLAIVANEARSRGRAIRPRVAVGPDPAAAAPSAEDDALVRIGTGPLVGALAALSADDRDVLVCRFVLDLGEEETASVLHVRRGTVKSRTSRALIRLRVTLGEAG